MAVRRRCAGLCGRGGAQGLVGPCGMPRRDTLAVVLESGVSGGLSRITFGTGPEYVVIETQSHGTCNRVAR